MCSRRAGLAAPAPHSWCSTPPAGRAPPASAVPAPAAPSTHPRPSRDPAERALKAQHRAVTAGATLTSSSLTLTPLAQCFRVSAHFFTALRCFQRCCFLRSSLSGTAPFSCTAASSTPLHHLPHHHCGKAEGHKLFFLSLHEV